MSLFLGHVANVPVRVHVSWLLVGLFLAANLAQRYAHELGCASTCVTGWILALIAALAISGSLIAHELGHLLAARRYHLPISAITLFAFGGVAQLAADPPSPRAEAVIALAGPFANLGLALGFALLAFAGGTSFFADLALANGLIAALNLLPGYPMDGGRLLRAWLWARHGNPYAATALAAQIGWWIGLFCICGGVVGGLALVNPLLGVWFILIGTFLARSAKDGARLLRLRQSLRDLSIGHLMRTPPVSVPADLSLEAFARQFVLQQPAPNYAVVTTDAHGAQAIGGTIGMHHLRRPTLQPWHEVAVGHIMTHLPALPRLAPEASALAALDLLVHYQIDLLPIFRDAELVGLLHRHDLLLYTAQQRQKTKSFP